MPLSQRCHQEKQSLQKTWSKRSLHMSVLLFPPGITCISTFESLFPRRPHPFWLYRLWLQTLAWWGGLPATATVLGAGDSVLERSTGRGVREPSPGASRGVHTPKTLGPVPPLRVQRSGGRVQGFRSSSFLLCPSTSCLIVKV